MDVLARQRIDLAAPPHPFTESGRTTFDALLQSRSGVVGDDLLVGDATLWSSTSGGVDSLRRFWSNIVEREASARHVRACARRDLICHCHSGPAPRARNDNDR
jgi:hypothetical protein